MSRPRVQRTHGLALDAMLQPLHTHMLPHLTLRTLVTLRRTCKSLRFLVDSTTGSIWKAAAAPLAIPPSSCPSLTPTRMGPQYSVCCDSKAPRCATYGAAAPPPPMSALGRTWLGGLTAE